MADYAFLADRDNAAFGYAFIGENSYVPDTEEPDITPPVITLLGSPTVNVVVNTSYVDAGATALDDVDGNVTDDIVTVNPVNIAAPATYIVTYNVDDAAGNSAIEVTRSVTVEPVDNTVDAFTLIDQTNAQVGSVRTSNQITVSGINVSVTASITGDGTFSVNGGAYTATPTAVVNGDTIRVRLTASTELLTAVSTILTISGTSDTFTVTSASTYIVGETYYDRLISLGYIGTISDMQKAYLRDLGFVGDAASAGNAHLIVLGYDNGSFTLNCLEKAKTEGFNSLGHMWNVTGLIPYSAVEGVPEGLEWIDGEPWLDGEPWFE